MSLELATMPAARASQLFESGALSPYEMTKAIVENIEALNPAINAFCWLDTDAALKAARESETRWTRGTQLGKLDGITFTVKDLSMTRGWPTRRGSRAIRPDGPWEEDAPSVARMREAGAVLLGKTTVPEFGAAGVTHSILCGVTRNPWNLSKSPGGSSGGASASVIAGMGTIALASDAAGSIRMPASMTGTFGLKTTFGRVPDYPSSYLGSLAIVGPITRTVEDASLCMDVITRHDSRDSYGLPPEQAYDLNQVNAKSVAGLRILYSPTLGFAKVDPELAEIVRKGVQRFESLGATVEEADFALEDPSAILQPIMLAGLANAFRLFNFSSADMALMNPGLLEAVEMARKISLLQYLEARQRREALGARMRKLHERYDLLITPTMALPTVDAEHDDRTNRNGDIKDRAPFSALFNLTKQPAASLPVGLTAEGIPVGMQVVGPLYGDRAVLRACSAYEAAFPFTAPDLGAITRTAPQPIPQGIQSMYDAISEKGPMK